MTETTQDYLAATIREIHRAFARQDALRPLQNQEYWDISSRLVALDLYQRLLEARMLQENSRNG